MVNSSKDESTVSQSLSFSQQNGENGMENGTDIDTKCGKEKVDGTSMEWGGGVKGDRRIINNLSFNIIIFRKSRWKKSVSEDTPFKYPEVPEVNIINDREWNPTTSAKK